MTTATLALPSPNGSVESAQCQGQHEWQRPEAHSYSSPVSQTTTSTGTASRQTHQDQDHRQTCALTLADQDQVEDASNARNQPPPAKEAKATKEDIEPYPNLKCLFPSSTSISTLPSSPDPHSTPPSTFDARSPSPSTVSTASASNAPWNALNQLENLPAGCQDLPLAQRRQQFQLAGEIEWERLKWTPNTSIPKWSSECLPLDEITDIMKEVLTQLGYLSDPATPIPPLASLVSEGSFNKLYALGNLPYLMRFSMPINPHFKISSDVATNAFLKQYIPKCLYRE